MGCFSSVILVHLCKDKPALMENCLCNFVSELAVCAVHRLPVAGSEYASPIHCAQCENALWPASWSCWYREDSSLLSDTVLRHWSLTEVFGFCDSPPSLSLQLQNTDAFITIKKLLLGRRFSWKVVVHRGSLAAVCSVVLQHEYSSWNYCILLCFRGYPVILPVSNAEHCFCSSRREVCMNAWRDVAQYIEEFTIYWKIAQLVSEVSNDLNSGRGERRRQGW